VHAEALAIIVVVTADFVFNSWDLEILPYYSIRHIPWCIQKKVYKKYNIFDLLSCAIYASSFRQEDQVSSRWITE
jgi:hypothetical protein